MLEAKLLHKKTNQKCKGCKDGGIYQNLWSVPLINLVIFSTPQGMAIAVWLGDNDKNLWESCLWAWVKLNRFSFSTH